MDADTVLSRTSAYKWIHKRGVVNIGCVRSGLDSCRNPFLHFRRRLCVNQKPQGNEGCQDQRELGERCHGGRLDKVIGSAGCCEPFNVSLSSLREFAKLAAEGESTSMKIADSMLEATRPTRDQGFIIYAYLTRDPSMTPDTCTVRQRTAHSTTGPVQPTSAARSSSLPHGWRTKICPINREKAFGGHRHRRVTTV